MPDYLIFGMLNAKCFPSLLHLFLKSLIHASLYFQGDSYYFCGEFATPVLALQKMLENDEVDSTENVKQIVLFTHTLRSILQSHPLCQNKALVASFADDTPGASLADELCNLMKTPIEQVFPIDTVDTVSGSPTSSVTV